MGLPNTFRKRIVGAAHGLGRSAKATARGISNGARSAGYGVARGIGATLDGTESVIKKAVIEGTEKTITNPLGMKTTALGSALIVGGAVAWGVGTGSVVEGRAKTLAENAEYLGNVGSMDYDGVKNVDRATGQRNFGATGDLVFGLNNSRRG